jgi:hypothetical protein
LCDIKQQQTNKQQKEKRACEQTKTKQNSKASTTATFICGKSTRKRGRCTTRVNVLMLRKRESDVRVIVVVRVFLKQESKNQEYGRRLGLGVLYI